MGPASTKSQVQNETRATYRMGRVQEVRKGTDGHVRSVVLQYKLAHEKTFRTVSRPIHGICVIVPTEEQHPSAESNETVPATALNPRAASFEPKI